MFQGSLIKVLSIAVVLALAFAIAPTGDAAEPAASVVAAPAAGTGDVEAKGDGKITVDYKQKPIAEIARQLSEISKTNIFVQEGIFERVTLVLPNPIHWRKVLDLVCSQIGCVAKPEGKALRIVRRKEVHFSVMEQDIKTVLYGIAKTNKQNIVIEGNITGKVTLNLTNVDWRSALYNVAKAGGYVVVEEDAGGTVLYRVVSPARLKAQLETKIFQLKFVRPPEKYSPYIDSNVALRVDDQQVRQPAAGPTPAPGGAASRATTTASFTLAKALQGSLSENGSLLYDRATNSFIVHDIKPKLDAIASIIKKVDVEPKQIAIEVKFVLTSNTDLFDAGINWQNGFKTSLTGGSALSRFPFLWDSFGLGDLTLTRGGPSTRPRAGATGIGLGSDVGAILDRNQDGKFDAAPFTLGTLDFTGLSLMLNLIKTDTQSEIVQEPRLLTLDNREATIFVGQTTHYAETNAETNNQGGLTFSIHEAVNSPVRTGFQLFFIPHIVPGTNRVWMTLIPEAETLIGTTSTAVPGFTRFTTKASEDGSTVLTIDLPTIQTQSLMTTLMLESGQTAVIGGLITSRETQSVNKIPFLGDIPILGWLFRSESHSVKKENLLIFITPRIISDMIAQLTPLYERYLEEQQSLYPWKYKKTDEEKKDAGKWLPRKYPKLFGGVARKAAGVPKAVPDKK